ncbi:MAG: ribulose-phosphate 3-epimerase [Candidatus Latescibacterota bacterium]|nr:MAG: ribulose-phosphate 3-epimerase [Candidatus Latescibacterota bacterium]
MTKIFASILAADFRCLEREVRRAEEAGADGLHLDVMDGHFVPNITFGPMVVAAVRKLTSLYLDVHLMIEEPGRYVDRFVENGADGVTVHIEVCRDPAAKIEAIRSLHVEAGLSLNPETPVESMRPFLSRLDGVLVMSVQPGFGAQAFMPSALGKIRKLRAWIDENGSDTHIMVDGGIHSDTAKLVREAGADVLVAGTALFGKAEMAEQVRILKGA